MIDSVTGGYDISRRPGTSARPGPIPDTRYPGTARAPPGRPGRAEQHEAGMHDLSHVREEE